MAAKFLVQPREPWRLKIIVHLVPAHIMVGQQTAAKLKAAIDSALAPNARLNFEFEIREFAAGPNQILVHAARALVSDAPGNGGLLYTPITHFGTLPPDKGAAIKQNSKTVVRF